MSFYRLNHSLGLPSGRPSTPTTTPAPTAPHTTTAPTAPHTTTAPTPPTLQSAYAQIHSFFETALHPKAAATQQLIENKFYEGKDLRVTNDEEIALMDGDLRGFWSSRIGKDPVARVGLAIWGDRADIAAAIDRAGTEYWKPHVSFASAIGLVLTGYPLTNSFHPDKKGDLVDYWSWIGEKTNARVVRSAAQAGLFDQSPEALATGPSGRMTTEQRDSLLFDVGVSLAHHHVAAVKKDLQDGTGAVPGLLSLKQIAAYHRQVFNSFGLSAATYGGTPMGGAGNLLDLQLSIGGGLYAPHADSGDLRAASPAEVDPEERTT